MDFKKINKRYFYLQFGITVLALLIFDPGTNGRNLDAFSNIKLIGFLLPLVVSLVVLLMPVLVYKSITLKSYLYWFVFLVFIPVLVLYMFNTLILLVN